MGGPRRASQPAEPAGDLRGSRVGLLHTGLRQGHCLPRPLLDCDGLRQFPGDLLAVALRPDEPGGRLVGSTAQGKHARRPGRATDRPVRAEQVAVAGDHPQRGMRAQHAPRLPQVLGDGHPGQQAGHRSGQLARGFHTINRKRNALRQRPAIHGPAARGCRGRLGGIRIGGTARDHQPGAPPVLALQRFQDGHRRFQVRHCHRVGRAAERGRYGFLSSVLHGHHGGHRAQNPAEPPWVRQQRRRSVLAAT